jgi:hypothetical protein
VHDPRGISSASTEGGISPLHLPIYPAPEERRIVTDN